MRSVEIFHSACFNASLKHAVLQVDLVRIARLEQHHHIREHNTQNVNVVSQLQAVSSAATVCPSCTSKLLTFFAESLPSLSIAENKAGVSGSLASLNPNSS